MNFMVEWQEQYLTSEGIHGGEKICILWSSDKNNISRVNEYTVARRYAFYGRVTRTISHE